MQFESDNPIVKLCAEGMRLEGEHKTHEAFALFQQAWREATNDFERFTAAHYVARHQKTIEEKLAWDITSLNLALKIDDDQMKGAFPSLYLNIGKGYEDLKDFLNAKINYSLADSFTSFLSDDGYGKMVRSGIANGLQRIGNM